MITTLNPFLKTSLKTTILVLIKRRVILSSYENIVIINVLSGNMKANI